MFNTSNVQKLYMMYLNKAFKALDIIELY